MLADCHTHLDAYPDDEVVAVLDRARDVGVGLVIVAGTTVASSERAVALSQKFPAIFSGVGIHPMDAGGFRPGRRRLHRRRRRVAHRRDGLRHRLRGQGPSTLGTFLRSFRWGHVRQLDRVSRRLLARAWAGWGRTRRYALTIDLDSTICETYGLAKEGCPPPRLHRRPWLSPVAGHCRRHRRGADGPAARGPRQHRSGAAHFLGETVGRVRYGGARGQLTVRADSGFYTHAVVALCRQLDVRSSITIRQHASLRKLIEAIPEQEWTPYPLPGRAGRPHPCGSSSGG